MKKEKGNNKNILMILITIISIALIFVSSYRIINWYLDIKESEKVKEKANEYVEQKYDTYTIDFEELKKQNKDTVAYLKVNNTKIDYVVVKGEDNSYYLSHDFERKYNIAGWVFATYQNKMDGTDRNIVIFGHNMRDGSMFGTMKKVLNKDWYNDKSNLTIKLTTKDGTFDYKVFSIYQIKPEEYYINTEFDGDEEYEEFLKTIKNRSIKDFELDINKNDKILTLSTCSMTGKERVVLHAKKVEKQ